MQVANKVTLLNEAGFKMSFRIRWRDSKGVRQETDWSEIYSIGKKYTMDLVKYNIPENAEMWPRVKAEGGHTTSTNKHVKFSKGSESAATYKITGTTLNIKFDLIGS